VAWCTSCPVYCRRNCLSGPPPTFQLAHAQRASVIAASCLLCAGLCRQQTCRAALPSLPCRLGVYADPAPGPWPTLKAIPGASAAYSLNSTEGLYFLVRMGHVFAGYPTCVAAVQLECRCACGAQDAFASLALLPYQSQQRDMSPTLTQRDYWNNPTNGRTSIQRTLVHMLSGQRTNGGELIKPSLPAEPLTLVGQCSTMAACRTAHSAMRITPCVHCC